MPFDTYVLIYSLDRNDIEKRAKARSLLRQLRRQSDDVIIPVAGAWRAPAVSAQVCKNRSAINREDLERIFQCISSAVSAPFTDGDDPRSGYLAYEEIQPLATGTVCCSVHVRRRKYTRSTLRIWARARGHRSDRVDQSVRREQLMPTEGVW